MLSQETDYCPPWISEREIMTVENISWLIFTKEFCGGRTCNLLITSGTRIKLSHRDRQERTYINNKYIFRKATFKMICLLSENGSTLFSEATWFSEKHNETTYVISLAKSWLSLSRPRLSRITAYLEGKIWSPPKHENLTTGKNIVKKRRNSLFHNIFNISQSSRI